MELDYDNIPTLAEIEGAVRTLQRACHGLALRAGWWKLNDGTDVTANPYAFSNKLMLTVSELAESMEGDRKNLNDDKLPQYPMRDVEVADAMIRLFDMAGGFKLNVIHALPAKLIYNANRPDHKPENRVQAGGKAY